MPSLLGHCESELLPQRTLSKTSLRSCKLIRSGQCVYGSQPSIRKIWLDTVALFCWL